MPIVNGHDFLPTIQFHHDEGHSAILELIDIYGQAQKV